MPYIFYTLIICMTWGLYFIFTAEIAEVLNYGLAMVGATFPFILLLCLYSVGVLINLFSLPHRFQPALANHAEFMAGGTLLVGMIGTYLGVQTGIDSGSQLGASFAHAINSTMVPMTVGVSLMIVIEMVRFNRELQKIIYQNRRKSSQALKKSKEIMYEVTST